MSLWDRCELFRFFTHVLRYFVQAPEKQTLLYNSHLAKLLAWHWNILLSEFNLWYEMWHHLIQLQMLVRLQLDLKPQMSTWPSCMTWNLRWTTLQSPYDLSAVFTSGHLFLLHLSADVYFFFKSSFTLDLLALGDWTSAAFKCANIRGTWT